MRKFSNETECGKNRERPPFHTGMVVHASAVYMKEKLCNRIVTKDGYIINSYRNVQHVEKNRRIKFKKKKVFQNLTFSAITILCIVQFFN